MPLLGSVTKQVINFQVERRPQNDVHDFHPQSKFIKSKLITPFKTFFTLFPRKVSLSNSTKCNYKPLICTAFGFCFKMSLTPLKPLNEKANYFNSAFISVTTIPKQNPEVFNRSTMTSKRARYLYLLCLSGFYSGTTATPTGG